MEANDLKFERKLRMTNAHNLIGVSAAKYQAGSGFESVQNYFVVLWRFFISTAQKTVWGKQNIVCNSGALRLSILTRANKNLQFMVNSRSSY